PTQILREAEHAADARVLVLAPVDDRLVDPREPFEHLRAARQDEHREAHPRLPLLQRAQQRCGHHDVADPVRHAHEDMVEGFHRGTLCNARRGGGEKTGIRGDAFRGVWDALMDMPTVLREGPYRIHFYMADRVEPPHMHVKRDRSEAKFWLDPVRLADAGRF